MRIAPKPKPGQEISLERLLEVTSPAPKIDNEAQISFHPKCMTIQGVRTRDGIFEVDIQYEPLARHISELTFLDMAKLAYAKRDFQPASCEEIYALLSTITNILDQGPQNPGLYKKALEGLQRMKELWMNLPFYTFTSYSLRERGKQDKVFQIPATSSMRDYLGALAGQSGRISDPGTKAQDACEMLFGEPDVDKVNRVFSKVWINDTHIYRDHKIGDKKETGLIVLGTGIEVGSGYSNNINPAGFHSIGIKTTLTEANK